jgi:hypothetical protein
MRRLQRKQLTMQGMENAGERNGQDAEKADRGSASFGGNQLSVQGR